MPPYRYTIVVSDNKGLRLNQLPDGKKYQDCAGANTWSLSPALAATARHYGTNDIAIANDIALFA